MKQISEAMRLAFGKCPDCGQRTLVYGHWLRWCEDRTCRWYGSQEARQL